MKNTHILDPFMYFGSERAEKRRFALYAHVIKDIDERHTFYVRKVGDWQRVAHWLQNTLEAAGLHKVVQMTTGTHYYVATYAKPAEAEDFKRDPGHPLSEPLKVRRLILHGLNEIEVVGLLYHLRDMGYHPNGAYQLLNADTMEVDEAMPIVGGEMFKKEKYDAETTTPDTKAPDPATVGGWAGAGLYGSEGTPGVGGSSAA